jgi:phosphoglycolate phosphatase-like HAD superfamily hydrolase
MAHPRISAFFSGGERSGKLAIFDKDGTLIDFHAMWGGWIVDLARRLDQEAAAVYPDLVEGAVAGRLFAVVGFDAATGRVDPRGRLAIASMAELRDTAAEVLWAAGLPREAADSAASRAWRIPDPVALARPLADLPALFAALRDRGARAAIATTDDRAPTEATVAALGIAAFVEALACGDDGHPLKPAPAAVLSLCRRLGAAPADTAVVGDTAADLRMGRAAGVGLTIGVLSGVGTPDILAPYADALLPSVGDLL